MFRSLATRRYSSTRHSQSIVLRHSVGTISKHHRDSPNLYTDVCGIGRLLAARKAPGMRLVSLSMLRISCPSTVACKVPGTPPCHRFALVGHVSATFRTGPNVCFCIPFPVLLLMGACLTPQLGISPPHERLTSCIPFSPYQLEQA